MRRVRGAAGERLSSLLRLARTGLLRFAGPLDRLLPAATRRGQLPPLWLRRHAGPVSKFDSSAREFADFLDGVGLLGPSSRVLDIGCGPGAMAAPLSRRLGPEGRYVGIDVHGPSIRWCRKRFGGDPRFSFEIAPISSPYGSRSGEPLERYRFPMGDGEADLVLAKSVFTHLMEPHARRYLTEIRRTLCPGHGAVVTAFLFDAAGPGLASARRAFPFADSSGRFCWRSRLRPTAAVAYDRFLFFEMVESAGLHVQWMSAGFFPGAPRPAGQDILLLGH